MPRSSAGRAGVMLCPRFRVLYRDEIALGPGKVDLLKAILETGSIRQAAANLEMSYMRAWLLIRTMNRCFKEPLVDAARGGSRRGGAQLTATGKAALALYEKLEQESLAATRDTQRELEVLLHPVPPSSTRSAKKS
jgi:molybdate transport system regulatory protein